MHDSTPTLLAALLLGALVSGCDAGGSRGATAAGATQSAQAQRDEPPPQAPLHRLVGRLAAPAPDAEVFAFTAEPAIPDLASLAESYLSGAAVDLHGGFELPLPDGPAPARVLVSAPGRALRWVDPAALDDIALAPEAAIELRLLDAAGRPAEGCTTVALDARGVPLPLPAAEVWSDASGHLRLGRLPAGRVTVLALAGDGASARLEVDLSAGDLARREVTLGDDPEVGAAFILATGGDAVASLLRESSR